MAIVVPRSNASDESNVTKIKFFFETWPLLSMSFFRFGFQWGVMSRTKWLPRAKGIASIGFPTPTAIAAPAATCGVSSIINVNNVFTLRQTK